MTGEEGLHVGARVWPEPVQRRGAWAAAIFLMVLASNMFGGWPALLPHSLLGQPWGQMLVYLLPVPMSFVVLPLLGPGSLRQVLRWRASARGIMAGLALGLVLALLAQVVARLFPSWFLRPYWTSVQVIESPRGYSSWLVFGTCTLVLAAPLTEEWVFRGLLWGSLSRVSGPSATNLTTAALFTICHGLDRIRDFPILFVFGLLIGWVRVRSGSIAPCFLAHSVWNLSIALAPFWETIP